MGEIINSFFLNMEVFAIIFLALGSVLLIIEVFVPGFGVFGVCGIISFALAFFVRIIKNSLSVEYVFGYLFITAIIAAMVAFLAIIMRKLLTLNHESFKFNSKLLDDNLEELIDKNGVAITDLGPNGKIMIDDKFYDAITEGKLIPKNSSIKVKKIDNKKIVVDVYKN